MITGLRFVLAGSLTLTQVVFVARSTRGDEPASKPVVVLVGDSIRLGYAPFVAERLKGVAEVVSPAENGADSANVLKHLDEWVIARKPAVVHLNAGLHDLKTDPKTGAKQVDLDAYKSNLARIVERLSRETKTRLVLATTTPVIDERHQAKKPFVRRDADVAAYNRAALEVLAASPAVIVDDLNAAAQRLGPASALVDDGVHFTPEAYKALAAQVAKTIRSALDGPAATDEAICQWAAAPPKIDGKLDDPAWKSAAVITRFPAFWSKKDSGSGTRAMLVWDRDALYYAATMTDSELRSFGTKRNDMLWNGDVFELFFKPSTERPEYYEFQVNPKSVILELPFSRRGEDFRKLAALPTLGMTAVATVDGTLDQPGDKDRGWTVEGRIPWSAFANTGGRPEPGATWRFALCRYDYGPAGTEPSLMSSAPLSRPSFHRYEDYGALLFKGPPAGN
jgi:lysophospholipase L1-like esterase